MVLQVPRPTLGKVCFLSSMRPKLIPVGKYFIFKSILFFCIQGCHRLDKLFFHDFSMIVSSFSMTISLPEFAFETFCEKHQELQTF